MSCGVAVKFVGCAMVCDVWCAVMSAEITLTGAKPSTKRLRQCSGSWATEIQHIFSVFDTFVFSLASTGHPSLVSHSTWLTGAMELNDKVCRSYRSLGRTRGLSVSGGDESWAGPMGTVHGRDCTKALTTLMFAFGSCAN